MTIEDEARAAAEKRYPITAEVEMDTNYFRRLGQRAGYITGYKDGASRPTGETHDEDTLLKVYDALMGEAGLSQGRAEDVVNAMLNSGILFRENTAEPAPADERETIRQIVHRAFVSVGLITAAELAGYKQETYDAILDRAADGLLASDVWRNRHPQPTEGEPTEDIRGLLAEADALVEAWDRKGSWTPDSPVGLVVRLASALRAAGVVADQEGENR